MEKILPLAFALLLLAYWADHLFHLLPHQPSIENRRPAPRPRVQLNSLEPFPKEFAAYYDDNFRWRGNFQSFNARLKSLTNGRSPLPDLVAIGKDNWFFKGGLQMDIYRGKRRFSPAELNEIVQELERRQNSIEARGGQYYLAIAPLKHHVYPQFLPNHVRRLNPEYATRQLYSALDRTSVNYIDLHAALAVYADTAASTELYYKTDHHWTVKAGLIASRTIATALLGEQSTRDPAPNDYYLTAKPGPGMTLAQMAGRDHPEQENFLTLHRRGGWNTEEVDRSDIPAPLNFPYPANYAKMRRQTDPERRRQLPSIFVNRESFGENLILPLSEYFGRSFWLFDEWNHDLNLDHYDREGGGIYLQLVWEGFLFNLLDEPAEDGMW